MTKIIHFIWVDKYDIFNPNIIIPPKVPGKLQKIPWIIPRLSNKSLETPGNQAHCRKHEQRYLSKYFYTLSALHLQGGFYPMGYLVLIRGGVPSKFKYKAMHKYQHIYCWFFYTMTHIVAFVIENNQYKTYLKYIFLHLIFAKVINYNQKITFTKMTLLKTIFWMPYITPYKKI